MLKRKDRMRKSERRLFKIKALKRMGKAYQDIGRDIHRYRYGNVNLRKVGMIERINAEPNNKEATIPTTNRIHWWRKLYIWITNLFKKRR